LLLKRVNKYIHIYTRARARTHTHTHTHTHRHVIPGSTKWTIRASNPDKNKRFSALQNRLDRFWGPPSFLCKGYQGFFLG